MINDNQIRSNVTQQISYYDFFRDYMKKSESQTLKNELLKFLNDIEKSLKKKPKTEANKKIFV